MITQTTIATVLILLFSSIFSGLKESDMQSSIYLREHLKPYLSGKENFLAPGMIEALNEKDNLPLFNHCAHKLQEKNNPHFSTLLSPLVTIFFDSDTINTHQFLFASLQRSPELLNKGIFALKKVKPSSRDISRVSKNIENSWHIGPLEQHKMVYHEWNGWCCINNLFFHQRLADHDPLIDSSRRISAQEKIHYWETASKPTFHPDFIKRDKVEWYRSQVKEVLLTFRRLRKEGGPIIDKMLICTCILPCLFEDEFAKFKDHCTIVGAKLKKKLYKAPLIETPDPEQVPFLLNFKEWYAQKQERCFKKLHTFETVKKILLCKIVE